MVGYVNVSVYVAFLITGGIVLSAENNDTSQYSTTLSDVVFVILSQPNLYHAKRARETQIHFNQQVAHLDKEARPKIIATHKKWPILGTWTIFPLLKKWVEEFSGKKWIFVCEDETRIDMQKFETFIQKYDPSQNWFIGHGLHDKEQTIIHHFVPVDKLSFPDFAAGFLLSMTLVKQLEARWPDDENFRADFSIDPKHEFASFILMDDIKMTEVDELCLSNEQDGCVTTYPVKFPDCGPPIDTDSLFVAVKTCEKFHKERVPVVLETWAKETQNLEFYSEVEDKDIPTIDIGVPNTERGHCGKTMAIMKRALTEPHIQSKKWLLVADDDTIININRLQKLLACYDADGLVALGERYGYQSAKGNGYDYITGGGGMVFSMPVVKKLVEECQCPSNDAPDDMIIGMCLKRMKIPITHVPYIHQARPDDYSEGYLSRQIPVSFHKHWNCDPYSIYKLLKSYDEESTEKRDEL